MIEDENNHKRVSWELFDSKRIKRPFVSAGNAVLSL